MESQQTPPISIRELASTLFIYKGTILTFTLLFCIGAAIVSWLQPEIFESSVQIWAQDQSPGLRGSSNYPNDSAARLKAALTNVREVIYSRRVLEAALRQCGMLELDAAEHDQIAQTNSNQLDPNGVSEPEPISDNPATQLERDRLVAWLSKSLRLEAPKGTDFGASQIFFLRMRDRDVTRAPRLLAAVLRCFRARYEQLSAEQAEHLLNETNNQLAESRSQLKDATEAFDRCVQGLEGGMAELNSMGGSAGGESELRRSLVQLNERLVPAQADLRVQQAFLQQLQTALANADELVNVPGTLVREYPSLEQAIRDLSSARSQWDAAAARLTPENAEYQSTTEHLRRVEESYSHEVARATSAIEREIEAKSEAVDFMRDQKSKYIERIAELTNRYVEFDGLRQELAQCRIIVADAEKRRSDAAHALLTAAQETLFATLDGPRTSSKPVSPQRKLNVIIGTMLGLITGIGMAFLARQFSQIVRSETDLSGIADDVLVISVPKVRKPLQLAS